MIIEGREVLLKALVGSHNYNLANEESDFDYKVFIAPTFEELYKGERFSKQIITPTEDNDIHDIRKMSDLFFKSNLNFLEVLSSNEVIIPNSSPEIHQIYALKKEIFKMNLPQLFNSCRGMYYNKMKLIHKGTEGTQHLVDAYGYDTKQATHAYRCMKVMVDFESTNFEDFDGAIRYSGDELQFMKYIRNGFHKFDEYERFVTAYFEYKFTPLAKKYFAQPVNLELKAEIERLTMELVKRNLK